MAITTITAASTRNLTTVAAVMQDIGPDGVGADLLLIESLIAQASASIEHACGTIFAQQEYEEDFTCLYGQELITRYAPLVSLSEVLLNENAITDYRIRSHEAGLLYRRYGWPSYADPAVTATYVAGYILPGQVNPAEPTGPRLPDDIERAALECVKSWHQEVVPSARVSSKTFGLTGDRIDYKLTSAVGALPPMTKRLLTVHTRLALA